MSRIKTSALIYLQETQHEEERVEELLKDWSQGGHGHHSPDLACRPPFHTMLPLYNKMQWSFLLNNTLHPVSSSVLIPTKDVLASPLGKCGLFLLLVALLVYRSLLRALFQSRRRLPFLI